MSRAPFLRQLGIILVDRARYESHDTLVAALDPEVPTGVDLYFVRAGAKGVLRDEARLEMKVMKILNSV